MENKIVCFRIDAELWAKFRAKYHKNAAMMIRDFIEANLRVAEKGNKDVERRQEL